MAKPLIVQAQELLANRGVTCPSCRGRGYDDSDGTQLGAIRGPRSRTKCIPDCRLCRGGGVVYLDKTCCCGYAAVVYSREKKIWWCGRTMCLEARQKPPNKFVDFFGAS